MRISVWHLRDSYALFLPPRISDTSAVLFFIVSSFYRFRPSNQIGENTFGSPLVSVTDASLQLLFYSFYADRRRVNNASLPFRF